jgi:putative ATP-binding cassette transporter
MEPSNKRLAALGLKAGMRHMVGLGFGMALIYAFIGLDIFTFPTFFGYSPEVVVGYTFALIYAAGPLQSIIDIYPMFVRARIATEKVELLENDLLNAQEQAGNDDDVATEASGHDSIRLVDVEFSYHGRNGEINHLGPFNLTINKNEVLFIAGGNGSGKTTLAKLICGLYKADRGKILYGDEQVSNSRFPEYRNRFSAVFSDFHILKDSPDTYDLAGLAGSELLEGFELNKSLLTREGMARSNELSQGQRRRLALLLAIHAGKSIYLFDEPGSDLDPAFKKYFYRRVLAHLKRKNTTIIVITHDDNYFPYADRIVTLRDGKIFSNEAHAGPADTRRGTAAGESVAG